jgi:hypothetical protein
MSLKKANKKSKRQYWHFLRVKPSQAGRASAGTARAEAADGAVETAGAAGASKTDGAAEAAGAARAAEAAGAAEAAISDSFDSMEKAEPIADAREGDIDQPGDVAAVGAANAGTNADARDGGTVKPGDVVSAVAAANADSIVDDTTATLKELQVAFAADDAGGEAIDKPPKKRLQL